MARPAGPEPSIEPNERDRPAADLPALIYDGDCAFCVRCADWIAARLPRRTLVVASQQADLASLRLSPEQASEAAWWVDVDGRQHRGHRAIAAALQACAGNWGRLGRVLAARPLSPVAAAGYELIARNRHRLGCRNCLRTTRRGGPALD